MAKAQSLPFFTRFIIHFRAKKPAKAAITIPKITQAVLISPIATIKPSSTTSFAWNTSDPKIAGMLIKKEKRVAFSRSTPANRPAERVEPEREMPGIIATAWVQPMMRAWVQVRLSRLGLSAGARRPWRPWVAGHSPATSSTTVVTRKPMPSHSRLPAKSASKSTSKTATARKSTAKTAEKTDKAAANKSTAKKPAEKAAPAETKPPVPEDIINLIADSIADLADDDGWIDMSNLGNLIIKKQPDFDPRTYGFGKLSNMLKNLPRFELQVRETADPNVRPMYVRDVEA